MNGRMRTENLSSAVLVDGTSGKLSAISCYSSKQSYMLFVGICLFISSEWAPLSEGMLWFL